MTSNAQKHSASTLKMTNIPPMAHVCCRKLFVKELFCNASTTTCNTQCSLHQCHPNSAWPKFMKETCQCATCVSNKLKQMTRWHNFKANTKHDLSAPSCSNQQRDFLVVGTTRTIDMFLSLSDSRKIWGQGPGIFASNLSLLHPSSENKQLEPNFSHKRSQKQISDSDPFSPICLVYENAIIDGLLLELDQSYGVSVASMKGFTD